MKVNGRFASPLCPWFLSGMPGATPTRTWAPSSTPTVWSLPAAASDEELQEVIRRIKEMNMS
ncbi:MAG: hypothetical protein R2751_10445 [Bacteroidales bacterium]